MLGGVGVRHGGLRRWSEERLGDSAGCRNSGVGCGGHILMGLVGRCEDFGLYSTSVGKQESDMVQSVVFVNVYIIRYKGAWVESADALWAAK